MPQQLTVRKGTAPAEGYYPGVAHISRVGRSVGPDVRLVAGPEVKPEFSLDERHCHYAENEVQCGSWPVKNKPNPEQFCAGHMRKLEAANGAEPTGDQGLRTSAP